MVSSPGLGPHAVAPRRHEAHVLREYGGERLQIEKVEAMARAAIDRSAGTMEVFFADIFVNDDLLRYLSQRAPSLKGLHLCSCNDVTNQGFAEAINGFPQLEELDITNCSLYGSVCEAAGRACPQLKCFRLIGCSHIPRSDTEALGIASTMPGLQELELVRNSLSNDGLMAILDGCPRLESLDVCGCDYIQKDDALELKFARIRVLKLPRDFYWASMGILC